MTLEQVKQSLLKTSNLNFKLPDGTFVPEHFHVTEIGLLHKHFIDCGGKIRDEKVISFQLWNASDTDHRLKPQKLLNIINLSQEKLIIGDHEVEVEYQSDTIGRYGLNFDGTNFILTPKYTACLAEDSCGIKPVSEKSPANSCCTPGSGCC